VNNFQLQKLLRKHTGLTPTELADLEDEALNTASSLEDVAVRRGLIARDRLYELLAQEWNIPYVDLRNYVPDPEALKIIPPPFARKLQVLPLFQVGNNINVALTNPEDIAVLDELRHKLGMEVSPVLVEPEALRAALDNYYPEEKTAAVSEALTGIEADEALAVVEAEKASRSIEELASEAPVVRLVNSLIEQAVALRASDIHIEPEGARPRAQPEENLLRVRLRIDGLLKETGSFPAHLHPVVTSRVKILAGMDISEKRKPQDGQFQFQTNHQVIDIRVSTFPTIYGENVVMRLLDRSAALLRLTDLGMNPSDAARFQTIIHQPHGIILVTGPTGSGKTTTLYAILAELNSPERNIVTLEDPVEYHLPLVRQCQVNPRAGMTFATGLRAVLRQDPDIILVGEIRDRETAEIAFQAALTGHLVLATLHTNDAASALTRMIDMNIEPFLIASSVIAILAQRLVRKPCPHCSENYEPAPEVLDRLGIPTGTTFIRGKGCPVCANRGYHGRLGVFELMLITPELRKLVMERRSSEEVKTVALGQGMTTLRADAIAKARAGQTTPEEVLRVTQDYG